MSLHPFAPRPSLWKGAVAGLAGGLVGTWVKSKVEPVLQEIGETLYPPMLGERDLLGADIEGHPERMPPAEIARDVAGAFDVTLNRDETLTAQGGIHWAFGTSAGVAYGVLAEVTDAEVGLGMPAAAALFAGTHASTLPALGLQASPAKMPTAWWIWEFGSHLVYGVTVDVVRRGVRRALR